jgi:hypothetical protein
MFIIFGWGRQTLKNYGQIYNVRCDCCNAIEQFYLYAKRTWVNLFFIPVIPYKTEYMIVCPACSNGILIDYAKFREYKYIVNCNLDLQNYVITPEEYEFRIRNLDNEYRFEGQTEVGRNYMRCIEEYERQKAQMNSRTSQY